MADLMTLHVDVSGALRGIRILREESIAFTIALALTRTAQDAQIEAQQLAFSRFRLRNDWTTRNIRITPATKQTLVAEVYTDTSNRLTGAPDYLPRQEDGGERVPVSGHKYLAIPTNYLYKYTSKNRPIPDNLRPRAILPPDAQIGATYAGSFSSGKGVAKRVIGKATLRRLGSAEYFAFIQKAKSGTLCIFVRHGARDAEPWYILTREAHLKKIFPMTEAVESRVEQAFPYEFAAAAAEVNINDMMRGTGWSVKL